jgi:hypothetical protein
MYKRNAMSLSYAMHFASSSDKAAARRSRAQKRAAGPNTVVAPFVAVVQEPVVVVQEPVVVVQEPVVPAVAVVQEPVVPAVAVVQEPVVSARVRKPFSRDPVGFQKTVFAAPGRKPFAAVVPAQKPVVDRDIIASVRKPVADWNTITLHESFEEEVFTASQEVINVAVAPSGTRWPYKSLRLAPPAMKGPATVRINNVGATGVVSIACNGAVATLEPGTGSITCVADLVSQFNWVMTPCQNTKTLITRL